MLQSQTKATPQLGQVEMPAPLLARRTFKPQSLYARHRLILDERDLRQL